MTTALVQATDVKTEISGGAEAATTEPLPGLAQESGTIPNTESGTTLFAETEPPVQPATEPTPQAETGLPLEAPEPSGNLEPPPLVTEAPLPRSQITGRLLTRPLATLGAESRQQRTGRLTSQTTAHPLQLVQQLQNHYFSRLYNTLFEALAGNPPPSAGEPAQPVGNNAV